MTISICCVVICAILKKEFKSLLALSLHDHMQSSVEPITGVEPMRVWEELKFQFVDREPSLVDEERLDFEAARFAAEGVLRSASVLV